ncbi:MAG: hypothetical protein ACK42K_12900, partial [Leptonema sp. (in: bacteria)]
DGDIIGFTLDREKHQHPVHDILMFTAANILDYDVGDVLVVGVPISYRSQKDVLKNHLTYIHGDVSVDGNSFRRISFDKIFR